MSLDSQLLTRFSQDCLGTARRDETGTIISQDETGLGLSLVSNGAVENTSCKLQNLLNIVSVRLVFFRNLAYIPIYTIYLTDFGVSMLLSLGLS